MEKQQAGYKKGELGSSNPLPSTPKTVQVEGQANGCDSQKGGANCPHREVNPQQVLINRGKTVDMKECQASIHAQQRGTRRPALGGQTSVEASIEGKDAGALHRHVENIPPVKRGLHGGIDLHYSQRHHADEDQEWTNKEGQASRAIVG